MWTFVCGAAFGLAASALMPRLFPRRHWRQAVAKALCLTPAQEFIWYHQRRKIEFITGLMPMDDDFSLAQDCQRLTAEEVSDALESMGVK